MLSSYWNVGYLSKNLLISNVVLHVFIIQLFYSMDHAKINVNLLMQQLIYIDNTTIDFTLELVLPLSDKIYWLGKIF